MLSSPHKTFSKKTNNGPETFLPLVVDPSLQSTWSHRAWVMSGCTSLLISWMRFLMAASLSGSWLQPITGILLGYLLADLVTGLYHWAIDNYGNASTPFFGKQIEEFQSHHKFPSVITNREFSNNTYPLGRAVTAMVIPINLITHDNPFFHAFVGMFYGCLMFSQQFHAWAHSTKTSLPRLVVVLQDVGVFVSPRKHAAHHRPPYNKNYCIVSGIWNTILYKLKVFEAVETMVFQMFGFQPRSWIVTCDYLLT